MIWQDKFSGQTAPVESRSGSLLDRIVAQAAKSRFAVAQTPELAARRANQRFAVQSRSQKFLGFTVRPNQLLVAAFRAHKRGVSRSSRTLGAECDGREGHD
jgi:hypothetical protein